MDLARRTVAGLGVLLEAPADDVLHAFRKPLAMRTQRLGSRLQNGSHGGERRVTLERMTAGQHLVEDDAECKHVGAQVEVLGLGLLWRHIADRADDLSGLRSPVRCGECRGVRALTGVDGVFRQPEIEHLDRAVRPHLDVRRFQIPVDDALRVRGCEGLGDLGGVAQRLLQGQRTSLQRVGQRFAIDQLHHQIVGPNVVARCRYGDGSWLRWPVPRARTGRRIVSEKP